MPDLHKFEINYSKQQGIAPIILIIILSVVFVGAFGVIYSSKKEIKIRNDETSEVAQLEDLPASVTTDKGTESKTEPNFKLSDKPFEQKDAQLPKFSFYPPDGWNKEKGGNYIAPTKDKISEGIAYLAVSPSINIAVVPKDFNNLDEALVFMKSEVKKSGIEITSSRKTKLNREETFFVEGVMRYGEISRSALEAEIDKEIKNAKKKVIVSEADIKKDIDEIVSKGDVKIIGYLFYRDGYVITYSGRALVEFWGQRGSQIKASLDTFKFE